MVPGEEVRRLRRAVDLIGLLFDPARFRPYADKKLGRCRGCQSAKAIGEVSVLGIVSWPLCARCMSFATRLAQIIQRVSA